MSVFSACVVDHSQIMSVDFCALAFYVALYFNIRILAAASCQCVTLLISGVPRNFFRGRGSTNSVEDRGERERGSGGGSPLVRGFGSSCNLVQEISFRMVKFS